MLLPGVTTLARLVARERDAATLRVWTELAQSASGGQARLLRGLLVVPDGSRRLELDRMRTAETVTSRAGMVRALRRVSDVASLGFSGLDLSVVPDRRVVALARYGMAAKATALRRHPEPRRLATLVATVRSLEAKAVDDALELFDVLMTNDLLARAARESRNEKLRRYPRLSKDAGKLASACCSMRSSARSSCRWTWCGRRSRARCRARSCAPRLSTWWTSRRRRMPIPTVSGARR